MPAHSPIDLKRELEALLIAALWLILAGYGAIVMSWAFGIRNADLLFKVTGLTAVAWLLVRRRRKVKDEEKGEMDWDDIEHQTDETVGSQHTGRTAVADGTEEKSLRWTRGNVRQTYGKRSMSSRDGSVAADQDVR